MLHRVMGSTGKSGYVVLRDEGRDLWRFVGEADRRPGLTARASRLQAIQDVTGGKAKAGEVYRVLPRSEWRLAAK
jgi:hypothetical protein